jgi:signal transduction histidine kinase
MAAIGLLAAGIAHEINNPLTSIAGFSEGLLKRLKTIPEFNESKFFAYFQDYLQIINNEAYRCRDTIQSLIRFSQMSSDDHDMLDVNQIVDDTASLIRQHAKDNGIRISVVYDAGNEKRRVVGNESELKHMFLNLLNNILDTTEEGGTVTVFTKNTGSEMRVVISNTEGDVTAVQHGETLHPVQPTRPGVGGTPLSLSICYNIMQHHQGDIQVNHMPGRGSAFILRFPAAAA